MRLRRRGQQVGIIRSLRLFIDLGTHPIFAKIAHFLGNQAVAKDQLRPSHLNHADSCARLMPPALDAAGHD